ncbi:MAG: DedA family protein [Isosphaeraceae bacterium]
MAESIIGHLGYVGIALILILGGLGLPIPEEAPVILAAVLSKSGKMIAPLALAACLVGVLVGDFIVYFLGYYYGEKVLSLRLTRRLLTKAREAQIKGYFHRHGFKILILGRFAVGFRTAAYLTAGILKLPPLKLFLTDLLAASLSTFLMFGLGYVFAQQIESGIREVQQYFAVALASGVVALLLYRFYRERKRAGLPVGPPVLYGEEPPLPPDDLKTLVGDRDPEIDDLPERLTAPRPPASVPEADRPGRPLSPPAGPAPATSPAPAVEEPALPADTRCRPGRSRVQGRTPVGTDSR